MAVRSVIFLMTTMVVKRGDIFYADLSPVIGSEQGGIRPVIIIQNDIGNKYSPTVIVAAITSQINKAKLPTHVEISSEEYYIINCEIEDKDGKSVSSQSYAVSCESGTVYGVKYNGGSYSLD